jgi:hypothetical protein
MRMNGSWHIYRPGERWKRPHHDMRIIVATSEFEAVGFNIPVAEFVKGDALRRHRELSRLGPDLLHAPVREPLDINRPIAAEQPARQQSRAEKHHVPHDPDEQRVQREIEAEVEDTAARSRQDRPGGVHGAHRYTNVRALPGRATAEKSEAE